jgi:hypothetical protein
MAGLAMLVQWHSSAAYTTVMEKRSSGNPRHAWLLGGTESRTAPLLSGLVVSFSMELIPLKEYILQSHTGAGHSSPSVAMDGGCHIHQFGIEACKLLSHNF